MATWTAAAKKMATPPAVKRGRWLWGRAAKFGAVVAAAVSHFWG